MSAFWPSVGERAHSERCPPCRQTYDDVGSDSLAGSKDRGTQVLEELEEVHRSEQRGDQPRPMFVRSG